MMQGYCALAVITPGVSDIDAVLSSAARAAADVTDCEVTQAVRDATVDGHEIKTGDYIAISGGRIVAVAKTAEAAALQMLEEADTDLAEIITLFSGKQVSAEQRATFVEELEELYPDCEIVSFEGGQDVYDYFLAIE